MIHYPCPQVRLYSVHCYDTLPMPLQVRLDVNGRLVNLYIEDEHVVEYISTRHTLNIVASLV